MIRIGDALGKAWQLFQLRPLVLVGALVVAVGLNLLPNLIMAVVSVVQQQGLLSPALSDAVPFILAIASYAITSLTTLGYLIITLKLCRGQATSLKDLFAGWPQLLSFCAASIVFTLITAFPIIAAFVVFVVASPDQAAGEFDVTRLYGLLVILPVAGLLSLYWGAQFGYFGFGIVEHNLAPLESLRFSHRVTQGLRWPLVGFTIVQGLLLLMGLLLFGLGLLVTLPVSALAYTWIYLEIQHGRLSVLG